MTNYLLDTCFILGLYGQNATALTLMQHTLPNQCHISVINRIELLGYHNISPKDEKELNLFLSYINCLELDKAIQDKAISLRKRHKIKLADSILLATALVHEFQLLTLYNALNNKFLYETQS